jgi:fluoroacetyl-CoA thioesterase
MDIDNLVGAVGHSEDKVDELDTSVRWSTGVLPIYSFSSMLHLMEKAACNSIQDLLPLGTTTIATSINIKHISITPIGHHVQAEAKVVKVEGQKIYFKIVAYDEKGKIGEGTHERFVVSADNFMEKISRKNIT